MDKMRSSPQRTRASAGSQGLAMGGGGGDRLVLASSSGDRSTEVLGPWMRGVGQAQGRVKVGGLAWERLGVGRCCAEFLQSWGAPWAIGAP